MNNNYSTKINFGKRIIGISTPIFFEWLFTVSLGAIDVWILSTISDSSAAAVGTGLVLLNLTVTALATMGSGGAITVAQLRGAGKNDEAGKAAACLMALSVGLGIILTIAYLVATPLLVRSLNVPTALAGDVQLFWKITGVGMLFSGVYWGLASVANANHNTKLGMYGAVASHALNTVLVCLLSLGLGPFPSLGLEGAAYAFTISRLFSTLLTVYIFFKVFPNALDITNLRHSIRTYSRRILAVAIPTMVEPVSYHVGMVIILSFIASLGVQALAARTYVTQVLDLAGIPPFAIACGCQLLMSYSFGAKKSADLRLWYQMSLILAFSLVFVTTIVIILIPNWILGQFTDNLEIIRMSQPLIFAGAAILYLKSFNFVTSASLRSVGSATFATGVSIFSSWLVGVPLAYWLVVEAEWGLWGIFVASGVDELIRSGLYGMRWYSLKYSSRQFKEK